jgi:acetyl-CoA acetyltransferase
MQHVVIAGVGIHPFGRFESGYRQLGAAAAREALDDAGVAYNDVDFTFVANVGAEMSKGQNVVELLGASGRPIVNVEAACGSSGSALRLGAELIEAGVAEIVLCIGVEKAKRGFIPASGYEEWQLRSGLGVNPVYFAVVAQQLLAESDATEDDLADVSVKNHRNGVDNPNAMYRKAVTREEVLASTMVCRPLRLLMLCAPNEGAAAAVIMSREEARRRGIEHAVSVRAVSLTSKISTDSIFIPSVSAVSDGTTSLGERAARLAYEEASLQPDELDVIECQDTDAAAELWAYSDLGLCARGDEAKLLRSGATEIGGRVPVNPSGGLLSKGEPLGASGLGQIHELVTQLRGGAGARQVEGARVGLAHVMGAGHTASVSLLVREQAQ